METKFTGREWTVEPSGNHGVLKIDCGGMMDITVITCAHDLSYLDTIERTANAHLIAVAPEMYKFLDDLANGRGTDYPIEQLLAKARGE